MVKETYLAKETYICGQRDLPAHTPAPRTQSRKKKKPAHPRQKCAPRAQSESRDLCRKMAHLHHIVIISAKIHITYNSFMRSYVICIVALMI